VGGGTKNRVTDDGGVVKTLPGSTSGASSMAIGDKAIRQRQAGATRRRCPGGEGLNQSTKPGK